MSECQVTDLKAKRDRGDEFLLLDVRTAEELDLASIEGSAHIPLHELEQRVEELAPWREKEIVVMCHHGMRSAMAQQFLLSQGFDNVLNLAGGIDAYSLQVDPDVARY